MIDFGSFISEEIWLAPQHPLAHNLELPIFEANHSAYEEIRAIKEFVRDNVSDRAPAEQLGTPLVSESSGSVNSAPEELRIPGVVKRIIPLDNDTSWEYWWCVPGRLLLPEDVELMTDDLPRVESILEQLVWLFGGHCFGKECDRQGDLLPVHDWQEVLAFARQQGFESYLLDIDYLPTAIKRYNQESDPVKDSTDTEYIAVEPAHWHIEFFQLTPTDGGFEIQHPKTICSCQIWTSKPFIKHLHTGETSIRYDLWVAHPLDLTQPPWLM